MIDIADHEARTVPRSSTHQPGHHAAVVVLLPLRIFLAAGWLRAAAEKLIDPQWWTGAKLDKFVNTQHQAALPFFRPVLEDVISPNARLVAIVVVVTQLACGLAIAIGRPLRLALQWAVLLNVVFIMSGKVNPSAFYLVMEIVLLFAIADGTIGVHPTTPSRRTVALAGLTAVLALAMAPYIRTIEPAEVIDDPAMMLVFLGCVTTVTLMVRRAAYRPAHVTYIRGLWATWVAGWMHAKPNKVVRDEFERWYVLRGRFFAPPQRGAARTMAPPPRVD